MPPAPSIIAFTTLSGLGYGLAAMLGLGLLDPAAAATKIAHVSALALISAGLLSSTAHLGNPQRAWRALSQWRSSWLSREGVMAIATFVPLVASAWLSVFEGRYLALPGLLGAVLCLGTVYCTSMIYASLKPVAQWHSRFTLPGYLIFAAMSGLTLLNAMFAVFGQPSGVLSIGAAVLTLVGWAWKRATWQHDDALGLPVTANSATGLAGGKVRSIEWPHSEENYLLKEMGFRVARKHRDRLRLVAQVLAFAVPAVLLGGVLLLPAPAATAAGLVAAFCQIAGLLVERWLFFADAKHTVMLYYGRT